MSEHTYVFEIGDEAIVAGDTANWGHGLDEGTLVRITNRWTPDDGKRMYESREWGYHVLVPDFYGPGQRGDRDIGEKDLEMPYEPVTEEEFAEAQQSILQTLEETHGPETAGS